MMWHMYEDCRKSNRISPCTGNEFVKNCTATLLRNAVLRTAPSPSPIQTILSVLELHQISHLPQADGSRTLHQCWIDILTYCITAGRELHPALKDSLSLLIGC